LAGAQGDGFGNGFWVGRWIGREMGWGGRWVEVKIEIFYILVSSKM